MTVRLIIVLVLAVLAAWSVSASRAGVGARALERSQTPASAIDAHQAFLAAEAARVARARQDSLYQTGDMEPDERARYEQTLQQERAERQRVAAAARAAAYARSIRNTRRTGGGYSGGK